MYYYKLLYIYTKYNIKLGYIIGHSIFMNLIDYTNKIATHVTAKDNILYITNVYIMVVVSRQAHIIQICFNLKLARLNAF